MDRKPLLAAFQCQRTEASLLDFLELFHEC